MCLIILLFRCVLVFFLKVKKEEFVSVIVIKGVCVSVKSLGVCITSGHGVGSGLWPHPLIVIQG